MREISLTQDKVALVDDEDFERLNQFKWYASIHGEGKRWHLGSFPDPVSAAKAYNNAARNLHGEFASLNTIPD